MDEIERLQQFLQDNDILVARSKPFWMTFEPKLNNAGEVKGYYLQGGQANIHAIFTQANFTGSNGRNTMSNPLHGTQLDKYIKSVKDPETGGQRYYITNRALQEATNGKTHLENAITNLVSTNPEAKDVLRVLFSFPGQSNDILKSMIGDSALSSKQAIRNKVTSEEDNISRKRRPAAGVSGDDNFVKFKYDDKNDKWRIHIISSTESNYVNDGDSERFGRGVVIRELGLSKSDAKNINFTFTTKGTEFQGRSEIIFDAGVDPKDGTPHYPSEIRNLKVYRETDRKSPGGGQITPYYLVKRGMDNVADLGKTGSSRQILPLGTSKLYNNYVVRPINWYNHQPAADYVSPNYIGRTVLNLSKFYALGPGHGSLRQIAAETNIIGPIVRLGKPKENWKPTTLSFRGVKAVPVLAFTLALSPLSQDIINSTVGDFSIPLVSNERRDITGWTYGMMGEGLSTGYNFLVNRGSDLANKDIYLNEATRFSNANVKTAVDTYYLGGGAISIDSLNVEDVKGPLKYGVKYNKETFIRGAGYNVINFPDESVFRESSVTGEITSEGFIDEDGKFTDLAKKLHSGLTTYGDNIDDFWANAPASEKMKFLSVTTEFKLTASYAFEDGLITLVPIVADDGTYSNEVKLKTNGGASAGVVIIDMPAGRDFAELYTSPVSGDNIRKSYGMAVARQSLSFDDAGNPNYIRQYPSGQVQNKNMIYPFFEGFDKIPGEIDVGGVKITKNQIVEYTLTTMESDSPRTLSSIYNDIKWAQREAGDKTVGITGTKPDSVVLQKLVKDVSSSSGIFGNLDFIDRLNSGYFSPKISSADTGGLRINYASMTGFESDFNPHSRSSGVPFDPANKGSGASWAFIPILGFKRETLGSGGINSAGIVDASEINISPRLKDEQTTSRVDGEKIKGISVIQWVAELDPAVVKEMNDAAKLKVSNLQNLGLVGENGQLTALSESLGFGKEGQSYKKWRASEQGKSLSSEFKTVSGALYLDQFNLEGETELLKDAMGSFDPKSTEPYMTVQDAARGDVGEPVARIVQSSQQPNAVILGAEGEIGPRPSVGEGGVTFRPTTDQTNVVAEGPSSAAVPPKSSDGGIPTPPKGSGGTRLGRFGSGFTATRVGFAFGLQDIIIGAGYKMRADNAPSALSAKYDALGNSKLAFGAIGVVTDPIWVPTITNFAGETAGGRFATISSGMMPIYAAMTAYGISSNDDMLKQMGASDGVRFSTGIQMGLPMAGLIGTSMLMPESLAPLGVMVGTDMVVTGWDEASVAFGYKAPYMRTMTMTRSIMDAGELFYDDKFSLNANGKTVYEAGAWIGDGEEKQLRVEEAIRRKGELGSFVAVKASENGDIPVYNLRNAEIQNVDIDKLVEDYDNKQEIRQLGISLYDIPQLPLDPNGTYFVEVVPVPQNEGGYIAPKNGEKYAGYRLMVNVYEGNSHGLRLEADPQPAYQAELVVDIPWGTHRSYYDENHVAKKAISDMVVPGSGNLFFPDMAHSSPEEAAKYYGQMVLEDQFIASHPNIINNGLPYQATYAEDLGVVYTAGGYGSPNVTGEYIEGNTGYYFSRAESVSSENPVILTSSGEIVDPIFNSLTPTGNDAHQNHPMVLEIQNQENKIYQIGDLVHGYKNQERNFGEAEEGYNDINGINNYQLEWVITDPNFRNKNISINVSDTSTEGVYNVSIASQEGSAGEVFEMNFRAEGDAVELMEYASSLSKTDVYKNGRVYYSEQRAGEFEEMLQGVYDKELFQVYGQLGVVANRRLSDAGEALSGNTFKSQRRRIKEEDVLEFEDFKDRVGFVIELYEAGKIDGETFRQGIFAIQTNNINSYMDSGLLALSLNSENISPKYLDANKQDEDYQLLFAQGQQSVSVAIEKLYEAHANNYLPVGINYDYKSSPHGLRDEAGLRLNLIKQDNAIGVVELSNALVDKMHPIVSSGNQIIQDYEDGIYPKTSVLSGIYAINGGKLDDLNPLFEYSGNARKNMAVAKQLRAEVADVDYASSTASRWISPYISVYEYVSSVNDFTERYASAIERNASEEEILRFKDEYEILINTKAPEAVFGKDKLMVDVLVNLKEEFLDKQDDFDAKLFSSRTSEYYFGKLLDLYFGPINPDLDPNSNEYKKLKPSERRLGNGLLDELENFANGVDKNPDLLKQQLLAINTDLNSLEKFLFERAKFLTEMSEGGLQLQVGNVFGVSERQMNMDKFFPHLSGGLNLEVGEQRRVSDNNQNLPTHLAGNIDLPGVYK